MKKTILLLISVSILIISSCSTLPLPGTPSESLLVIPVKIDRDLGNRDGKRVSITMASLELSNIETGKKKKMTLIPGDDTFFTIQLEPGRYQLDKKLILTISETPGSSTWVENEALSPTPILIEKSIVYISRLVLKVEGNGDGGYDYEYYYSSSEDDPVRRESVEALKSERRFKAWELYQMVGWKTED